MGRYGLSNDHKYRIANVNVRFLELIDIINNMRAEVDLPKISVNKATNIISEEILVCMRDKDKSLDKNISKRLLSIA